ncbi:MAG: thiamine phosphate synthase [Terracidiphilus sp.]|jgi:thiamine-phosphate pyrophosphorylase
MAYSFPKIYPILDSSVIPVEGRAEFLKRLGESLAQAGVTLLEYRNKNGSESEIVADGAILRTALPAGDVKLILDDRVDLVDRLGFDGAHVDGGDLSPSEARRVLGSGRIVGTFGGSEALVRGVLNEPADYFSIGPVGETRTKQTAKAPIGAEGVRLLRAEAGNWPVLVAAGGVTLANAAAVLAAGADVVAVSEALFRNADPAGEFRRWMVELG